MAVLCPAAIRDQSGMRKSVCGFPPASRSRILRAIRFHELWLIQPKFILIWSRRKSADNTGKWTVDSTLIIIGVTFLLAGAVKGIVGFGLPTVALAVVTALLGHTEAIAIMLAPSLVTNAWQAFGGGHLHIIIRRMGWFLLAGAVMIFLSARLLTIADPTIPVLVLGLALCVYSLVTLMVSALPPPGTNERWLNPLVGAVTGVLTGLTGTFVVPSVLYFQSLGLQRDVLIQTMGVWFFIATVMLLLSLGTQGLLTSALGTYSVIAIAPALAGMMLGQAFRKKLSESMFKKVFLCSLFVLGVYIVIRTVSG